MGKNIKKPGSCIFCGKIGSLSKEHVFSEWLHELIPATGEGSIFRSYESKFLDQIFEKSEKVKNQDMRDRTQRIVCVKCNNEWMSAIVNEAKPVVKQLFSGELTAIADNERVILSKWIALTTIIAEYVESDHQAITDEYRKELFSTKVPGEGCLILIGFYDGDQPPLVYKRAFGKTLAVPTTPGNGDVESSMFQLTTLIFGKSIILSANMPEILDEMFLFTLGEFRKHLVLLWPTPAIFNKKSHSGIIEFYSTEWPPQQAANDETHYYLSNIANCL